MKESVLARASVIKRRRASKRERDDDTMKENTNRERSGTGQDGSKVGEARNDRH